MENIDQKYSAFISHASEDKDKADEICRSLEEAGYQCWVAPRDVKPGADYGEEIIHGIEQSRCLILVLSENANSSIFVKREVERAVSKKKPVFPVRIEEVMPSPGLELFVSTTHWIDAWRGPINNYMGDIIRGLSDENLIDEMAKISKRIVFKRKLSRRIASISFVIFIGASVGIVNHYTQKPPQVISTGPHQTIQQIEESLGIDIDEIDSKDFSIRLEDKNKNYGLHSFDLSIHTGNAKLAKFLYQSAQGYISFNSSDYVSGYTLGKPGEVLVTSIQDVPHQSSAVWIKFEPSVGYLSDEIIGPLKFDYNIRNAVLNIYKQRALDRVAWGVKRSFSTKQFVFKLEPFYPAIQSIDYGFDTNLSETIEFNGSDMKWGKLSDRLGSTLSINLPKDNATLYLQFTFFDGTKSPIRAYSKNMISDRILASQVEEARNRNIEFDMAWDPSINKKAGALFLAQNRTRANVISLENGLQYRVITNGHGMTPDTNDYVEIHYRGQTLDGVEFISSLNERFPTKVEIKNIIPGLAEALKRMQEGTKWELFIPANLAYGAQGNGEIIGPEEVLIYEVKLIKVLTRR